jgi:hypothetical protein
MSERQPEGHMLKSLHIDFHQGIISLHTEEGKIIRLRVTPLDVDSLDVQRAVEVSQRDDVVTQEQVLRLSNESQRTFTLTGRIKGAGNNKPAVVDGRPDGKGNPTAWTRLAVHIDGEDQAKMLSTTFHRAATRIALGLALNDQITASGYIRPSQAEGRMDSFSVYHLIDYPGKPAKQTD